MLFILDVWCLSYILLSSFSALKHTAPHSTTTYLRCFIHITQQLGSDPAAALVLSYKQTKLMQGIQILNFRLMIYLMIQIGVKRKRETFPGRGNKETRTVW